MTQSEPAGGAQGFSRQPLHLHQQANRRICFLPNFYSNFIAGLEASPRRCRTCQFSKIAVELHLGDVAGFAPNPGHTSFASGAKADAFASRSAFVRRP